ncbi:MAG: tRNA (adenosine(37)-N6)-threonylcarbamoyltransferase complex dimerization subunit type 1 TsaB [Dehalococcoidia bacterium]
MLELSLDTASETASIALSRGGEVFAESTWQCRRNHTVELLPAIDRLFAESNVDKADLTAVFVSTGPGMYTGLRVGIAVAKGLARAANLPLVGIGRLELDAYPHRAFDGDVIAIHKAGRGDLAWASYRSGQKTSPPKLSKPAGLASLIRERTLFLGEIDDELAALLRTELGDLAIIGATATGRATALATLGHERLASGAPHEPALVVPIYLRPPAIGPQTAA